MFLIGINSMSGYIYRKQDTNNRKKSFKIDIQILFVGGMVCQNGIMPWLVLKRMMTLLLANSEFINTLNFIK